MLEVATVGVASHLVAHVLSYTELNGFPDTTQYDFDIALHSSKVENVNFDRNKILQQKPEDAPIDVRP